jgi:hypothetical protein
LHLFADLVRLGTLHVVRVATEPKLSHLPLDCASLACDHSHRFCLSLHNFDAHHFSPHLSFFPTMTFALPAPSCFVIQRLAMSAMCGSFLLLFLTSLIVAIHLHVQSTSTSQSCSLVRRLFLQPFFRFCKFLFSSFSLSFRLCRLRCVTFSVFCSLDEHLSCHIRECHVPFFEKLLMALLVPHTFHADSKADLPTSSARLVLD